MKKILFFCFLLSCSISNSADASGYTHMIVRSVGTSTDYSHRLDQKTTGFRTLSDQSRENEAQLRVGDVEHFSDAQIKTAGMPYIDARAMMWNDTLTMIVPYKDAKHYLLTGKLIRYTSLDDHDVFYANGQSNIIDTQGGNDTVYLGAGDDQVTLGTGSNYADGGSGTDTAHYPRESDFYYIRRNGESIYVQSKDGAKSSNDNLQRFEHLQFTNGIMNIADIQ